MKILMVSIDRGLLGKGQLGDVVERHREYGKYVERLDIVVFSPKGFEEYAISEDVHAYPTNSPSKMAMPLNALDVAKTLFAQQTYDLVVAQDPFLTGWVGLRLKKKFGSKLLVHLHGDFFDNPEWLREDWKNRFLFVLGKSVVRQADGLRVMSTGQKEKLVRSNIPENRIRVISTPVNLEKYQTYNHTGVEEFAQLGKPIVLHVGRRDNVKDFATLFRAWSRVSEAFPQTHFWQAGADLVLQDLKKQYSDITFPENVFHPLGRIEAQKLLDLYHASDVVVLSSRSESFGKVLVEANACGKPVVATATTGAQEIIREGVNGFLVPIGDSEKLAEKILEILQNPVLGQRMGENGKKIVQEKFDGRKNTENIIQWWNELVKK